MLRRIRVTVAIIVFSLITILFLDFTGSVHAWLGWVAKIQFIPALLALNAGIVIALIIFTLLFGRLYCSVICPLGIFQDIFSRIAATRKKYRFFYSRPITWLRYGILALFTISLIAGIGSLVSLLEPYSAYGRMVSNLFAPIYTAGNNLLAFIAEKAGSYAFYSADIWIKSIGTFIVAAVTFIIIAILALRNGRTYCNTICPVGTLLGIFSRYSLYKPRFDTSKCNGCKLCARNCKASCIDPEKHRIDYSRCVTCFDCIETCRQKAIVYERRHHRSSSDKVNNDGLKATQKQIDNARRSFLTASAILATTAVLNAKEKKADGGLAFIRDKKIPPRTTKIVPPGAQSIRHFSRHCTGCQLCVTACPNNVLRPSASLDTFMQPQMSYERGYCRPECTKCSEICPAGAIHSIDRADKSATQIGHAVWIKKNCVVITDKVHCGNCARHCPAGAIQMVDTEPGNNDSLQIPVINTERCIGCGACEYLCPSRPFSAIYVEGHQMHRTI